MAYTEHKNGYGRTVIRRVRDAVESKRSDLACPMVIGDTIEPTRSVADGVTYTSMREYQASLKRAGLTIADGPIHRDLPKPERDREADIKAIDRAIADVENGRAPPVIDALPV